MCFQIKILTNKIYLQTPSGQVSSMGWSSPWKGV